MAVWHHLVTEEQTGRELLAVLRQQGISSGMIRRLKTGQGILVDGIPTGVRERVQAGQTVTLQLPESPSAYIQPIPMELTVLYEDDWLLAVNKPADLPVHPSQGHHTRTLAAGVAYYMNGQDFTFRPITRLDRYTSGIVLIAKDAVTAALLCEQIAAGKMEKTYYAITQGIPQPRQGRVDAPIGRVEGSVLKRQVTAAGKPAVTHYRVVEQRGGRALVELRPLTGRTHQIRVHMAHMGCPLVYDFLYGKEEPGKHFYLHCSGLGFTHPVTGAKIHVKSPQKFPELD